VAQRRKRGKKISLPPPSFVAGRGAQKEENKFFCFLSFPSFESRIFIRRRVIIEKQWWGRG